MENILRQRYKLNKAAARSVVAEARTALRIGKDVMFTKPLQQKCISIAEERGFLEDGKPVEKKPQRTTWRPSQKSLEAIDLRNRVNEILAHPESLRPSARKSTAAERRQMIRSERKKQSTMPTDSGRASSVDRSLNKPGKTPSNERPRMSRFVRTASFTGVLDPIAETSYSTDDDSVGSLSERPPRRSRRAISSTSHVSQDTATTASSACISDLNILLPLRRHITSIAGGCTELDIVVDHAKGFRATDFDTRSFASLTVSTDGESVSSGGSSLQRGISPRRLTDSPRKSVSMGSSTVKSLAMRFESEIVACMSPSSPRPVPRYLSDEEDECEEDTRPIRGLHEPPIGVIVTSARICPL